MRLHLETISNYPTHFEEKQKNIKAYTAIMHLKYCKQMKKEKTAAVSPWENLHRYTWIRSKQSRMKWKTK